MRNGYKMAFLPLAVMTCAVASVAQAPLDVERLVKENEGCALVVSGVRAETGGAVQSSGCIIDSSGHVLTTAHQVAGVGKLLGRDHEGREYHLDTVTVAPELELALLKTREAAQHWARLGDALTLQSGAPLISIAAPTSLDFSTVTGVVSNAQRTYQGRPVIQADLPASPGSSGGPVFDRNGLLVGLIIGKLQEQEWVTVLNPVNNAFGLLRAQGVPVPAHAESGGPENTLEPEPGVSESERQAIEAYNRGVGATTPAEKTEAYTEAVRVLPQFYEAWFNLGVAATAAQHFESASAAYLEAERLRPDAVEVQRNLGLLALRQSRQDEAITRFTKAVTLAPDSPLPYNDLGEAHRRAGNSREARAALEKALQLAPDYTRAHYNLGLVLAQAGEAKLAIEHFEAYLRLEPGASDLGEVKEWIAKLRAPR